MSRTLIVAALAVVLCGCAPMSDDRALRALESQGYTDIELTGMAFFGCGEKDYLTKGFTANGANGERVEGVVCGGIFKGATVRID